MESSHTRILHSTNNICWILERYLYAYLYTYMRVQHFYIGNAFAIKLSLYFICRVHLFGAVQNYENYLTERS